MLFSKLVKNHIETQKKKKLGLQINQMLKDKPKKHEFVFKKNK